MQKMEPEFRKKIQSPALSISINKHLQKQHSDAKKPRALEAEIN